MKKVLITGISGYIGSCLATYLQKKYTIKGVDKKKFHYLRSEKIDLLNFKKLDIILKKFKPDIVIHLAAQSLVDESINKKKYYLNNIEATKNLILCLKKNCISNLIFSSTAAVYKYANNPLRETSKIMPKSTYAKTKYECEKLIKSSGLNYIILRFFNVCSSMKIKNKIIGELHNPETHLIPTVVYKNIFKKKIYIYGDSYKTKDGTCVRDYVHIKDICIAIKKSINKVLYEKTKDIINIGSETNLTILDILDSTKKITKINSKYKFTRNRKGDVDKLTCSISKAKRILNWFPTNSNINKIIKDEILWVKFLNKHNLKRKFKNY